jgi:hypothetical protein
VAVEFDTFSIQLLDEAKRFLEKADDAERPDPFLHAALVLAFSSLESHLNGVAEELRLRQDTSLLDNAILSERGLRLKDGEWQLTPDLKFYRLEDRIVFLFRRYAGQDASVEAWWSVIKEAINARNGLVHPRDVMSLRVADVERLILSIVDALNALYMAVFGKGHPAHGRGLQSTLTF